MLGVTDELVYFYLSNEEMVLDKRPVLITLYLELENVI